MSVQTLVLSQSKVDVGACVSMASMRRKYATLLSSIGVNDPPRWRLFALKQLLVDYFQEQILFFSCPSRPTAGGICDFLCGPKALLLSVCAKSLVEPTEDKDGQELDIEDMADHSRVGVQAIAELEMRHTALHLRHTIQPLETRGAAVPTAESLQAEATPIPGDLYKFLCLLITGKHLP